MQNDTVLFTQVAAGDFLGQIRAIIKDELQSAKSLDEQNRFLTVREVMVLFGITKVSVYNWIKADRLIVHKKGKRTFFKKSEIDASMTQIKRYKHA